jgi:CMP/dCMP kinase
MSEGPRAKTVAISRQQGSGGSYIGRAVAERLGLRYFDREMLRTAAEYLSAPAGSSRETGQASDSWFERLGNYLSLSCLEASYTPPSLSALYEGELFDLENRLIKEIVDDHVAVIVGRGAAQTLRGRHGVVAVFVHAPEKWRVDRVQQVYRIADRAEAARMVQRSDQDRARFVRGVAGIEWTNASSYDLTIDSAALGFDGAVELILRAVSARGAEASATLA